MNRKSRIFNYSIECQNAFDALMSALTPLPALAYQRGNPDTEASNTTAGGALSQLQDGKERVIDYYCKAFTKPERNYCTTRRECLTVAKALSHFNHYLYGRRFIIRTNQAALTWLICFKEPEGQAPASWNISSSTTFRSSTMREPTAVTLSPSLGVHVLRALVDSV